jgi:hypothetical protein
MDQTKKTLSIDIDTTALNQSVTTAKTAVSALTDQLKALKAAGQDTTPTFTTLSNQLKTTTTDLTNSTTALQAYTAALTKKTQAEQADNKVTQQGAGATPGDGTSNQRSPQLIQGALPPLSVQDTSATDTSQSIDPNAQRSPQLQSTAAPMDVTDSVTGALAGTVPASAFPQSSPTNDPSKQNLPTVDLTAQTAKTNLFKRALTDVQGAIKDTQGALNNYVKTTQVAVDKETLILSARDSAYLKSTNTIIGLFGKNTEANKQAVQAKKLFTAVEIAINTEQQVSSYISATATAVNQDMLVPIIGPALAAVDIAIGAVEVATAIADGAKQVTKINSLTVPSVPTQGKARGGIFQSDGMGAYLTGPGTGTSDSINARLSNGESVINARSTQMFAPILSAINQAGGGVAFSAVGSGAYAQGGLFNGSNTLNDGSNDLANTRAINNMVKTMAANMPRQVLVVEDVQASLQNKVMLQNMSNF